MSVSAMRSIEPHRIAGWKSAHNRSDRSDSSAKKQMHVIGHQGLRATGRNHLLKQLGEPFKKILPVCIILKNSPLFDSSDENMVQSAGCLSACGHAQAGINAGLTWHAFQIPLLHLLVNKETTSPYLHS